MHVKIFEFVSENMNTNAHKINKYDANMHKMNRHDTITHNPHDWHPYWVENPIGNDKYMLPYEIRKAIIPYTDMTYSNQLIINIK